MGRWTRIQIKAEEKNNIENIEKSGWKMRLYHHTPSSTWKKISRNIKCLQIKLAKLRTRK